MTFQDKLRGLADILDVDPDPTRLLWRLDLLREEIERAGRDHYLSAVDDINRIGEHWNG